MHCEDVHAGPCCLAPTPSRITSNGMPGSMASASILPPPLMSPYAPLPRTTVSPRLAEDGGVPEFHDHKFGKKKSPSSASSSAAAAADPVFGKKRTPPAAAGAVDSFFGKKKVENESTAAGGGTGGTTSRRNGRAAKRLEEEDEDISPMNSDLVSWVGRERMVVVG